MDLTIFYRICTITYIYSLSQKGTKILIVTGILMAFDIKIPIDQMTKTHKERLRVECKEQQI